MMAWVFAVSLLGQLGRYRVVFCAALNNDVSRLWSSVKS